MEKKDNSDDLKKYKFYRKPSIKRKGPEIKHTKTSLARMLIGNPLLKYENEDLNNKFFLKNLNRGPLSNKCDLNKPITLLCNGPSHSNLRVPSLGNIRLSSSEFYSDLSSSLTSTMISQDEVFDCDKNKKQQTQKTKVSSKTNKEKENKCPKRKSISSQFMEKKLKEVRSILKNSHGITKRRSRSLESIQIRKNCRIIEEESPQQSIAEAHSEQNLSTMLVHTDTPFRYVRSNSEEIDDENKENVDIGLVDSESYENLVIR